MTVVDESNSASRYSRRGFLKRAGVGAGAIALSGGGALPPRAQAARSRTVATSPTTFGRLFPDLPAFAPATPRVREALSELGAPGGPLDANDDLRARRIERLALQLFYRLAPDLSIEASGARPARLAA